MQIHTALLTYYLSPRRSRKTVTPREAGHSQQGQGRHWFRKEVMMVVAKEEFCGGERGGRLMANKEEIYFKPHLYFYWRQSSRILARVPCSETCAYVHNRRNQDQALELVNVFYIVEQM